MAGSRRRGLATSRRRLEEEGEEEQELGDLNSDSHSEASFLTDEDNGNESDSSDIEEDVHANTKQAAPGDNEDVPLSKTTITANAVGESEKKVLNVTAQPTAFAHTAETEAMMNGLKIEEGAQEEEAIHFEDSKESDITQHTETASIGLVKPEVTRKRETLAQRRAREHDEYKTKRESDPAFVPTRGGFFMHDQRNNAFGSGMPPQFARGRGRGALVGVPGAPRPAPQLTKSTTDKWHHDLHETVAAPRTTDTRPQTNLHRNQPAPLPNVRSLSKTTTKGMVQIRISLPFMKLRKQPLKMVVQEHIRLPDLRPPLRRDKPVRISLPGQAARYVFPSVARSFIFISRAQRPGQQVVRQQSRTIATQPGSRTQSLYSGSAYAPSGASRRSSVMQEVAPNVQTAVTDTSRPTVKLPAVANGEPVVMVPNGNMMPLQFMQDHPHPPPAQPLRQEARRTSLPMHQPRPQKAVSLATIDSPDPGHAPQAQEQPPFHQQVPSHMGEQAAGDVPVGRQQSFQGQLPAATPLSSIPEIAINAQAFHPGGTTPYYPNSSYSAQPLYYYQQQDMGQDQYSTPTLAYVQQGNYYLPMMGSNSAPPLEPSATSPSGTYAHESNGMVYYYDSAGYMNGQPQPAYGISQPTSNDGFYYGQNAMYYPSQ